MESTLPVEAGAMPGKNPAELALELYKVLLPYPSEIRQRAVQSALTSLGETEIPPQKGAAGAVSAGIAEEFADLKLGPKALKWIQKHGITRAMLEELFHMADGRFDITASSVPGSSKREMTVNCYLLSGVRGLLKDDAPSLDENESIAVCKRLTAYDKNNHTTNRNSIGNRMSGSKPTFTLTGPGETAAAELVKQMAQG